MQNNRISDFFLGFAEFTVFHFFASFALQNLLFILKIPLSQLAFFAPFLIWPLFVHFLQNKKVRPIELGLIYLAYGLLIFGLFSYFKAFIEHTFDGNMYHGEAMVQFIKGWNPYYDTNVYLNSQGMIWVKLYPKFSWIYSAYLVQLFSHSSAGMILNTLVALVTFIKATLYLTKKTSNLLLSISVGLVIFLNPIFIEQIHTFYVDAMLGNLVILLLLFNLELSEEQSLNNYVYVFFISVLLINIKFTGFVFAGIIDASVFLYFLFKDRKQTLRYFIWGSLIILFGLVLFGFSPYMNNLILGRNLFFPLMGKDKWDIMTYLILEPLVPLRSYERFFYSITFGEYMKNLVNFTSPGYLFYDQRIGGFGLHFFKLLVLSSLVIGTFILQKFRQLKLSWVLLFLMFSISVLVNYQNIWWARYAPHLWVVFGLAILALAYLNIPKTIKIGVSALILFLVVSQAVDIYSLAKERDLFITNQLKDIYDELSVKSDLIIYVDGGVENVFSVFEEFKAKENGLDIKTVLYTLPESPMDCYVMDIYRLCVVR